jgi:hypothetical protein
MDLKLDFFNYKLNYTINKCLKTDNNIKYFIKEAKNKNSEYLVIIREYFEYDFLYQPYYFKDNYDLNKFINDFIEKNRYNTYKSIHDIVPKEQIDSLIKIIEE